MNLSFSKGLHRFFSRNNSPEDDNLNTGGGRQFSKEIWLIDDDEVMNYITRRLIHSVSPDVKITEFLNVKMALEKLRIEKSAPHIILLDINMPGLSGWDFLEQMTELDKNLKIFMYSSSIDPDDVRKAKTYPVVCEFIPKPLEIRTIQHLLGLDEGYRKVS